MKTTSTVIGALGLMALAAGCAVDAAPQEEIATNEEAVNCDNNGATHAVLAGMAVAAAKEMTRWLPQRDFECESSSLNEVGTDYGPNGVPDGLADYPGKCIRYRAAGWRMWTSPKGRAKCPNSNCRNVHALMKLQDLPQTNDFVFGDESFDPGLMRSRLYSYWDRQFICINRPDNHTGDDCPVEYHGLQFSYKVQSTVTCNGGWDFWFNSWKAEDASKGIAKFTVPLTYPHQLKNMLLWAGGTDNAFLRFENNGNKVKIDPVGGTGDGTDTTSGSCTVVGYNSYTQKCGQVYSPTVLTGQCCTCNGVNKTFQPASIIDYYKCM